MHRLLTVIPALLLFTACTTPPVAITYHQTGACNGGQGQSGMPSTFYSAGSNQAYVVFGIERIDNSQGTSTFNFDPTKLFVNSTVRDFVDPNLSIYKYVLGPFASVNTSVTAGNNMGFSVSGQNALVVQTVAADGASEANKTNYVLSYNTGAGDPGVLLVKSDSSQTSWPNTLDCATISLH
jgi:hypothetical protein